MEEIERPGIFIARDEMLLPTASQRLYTYVADWNRIIGSLADHEGLTVK
jgi:hypothetical protein